MYPVSRLHFIRLGQGPPVLMIHGNPATHTLWRPLAEPMSRDRTVYAIDLPGFGQSPAPESRSGFALERLAEVVIEFARQQGLDRFDLMGHSFGGAISATIADMRPDLIDSLTLITPLGIHTPPIGRLANVAPIRGLADSFWRVMPAAIKHLFSKGGAHLSYGAAYSTVRANEVAAEAARRDIIRSMCGLMVEADLARYAEAIDRLNQRHAIPLLLVGAGRDRIVPFRQFERIQEKLPRATLHLFPEGGHVPMWEFPTHLLEIVRRFYSIVETK